MSVLDTVMQQLDSGTIQKMAGQLGASPQQTHSAIAAALPLLIGAMQRNAAQPAGAVALHNAVVRDHQNVDLGGLLGGILGGGGADGLMGVLGSVLGGDGGAQQRPEPARRQDEGGDLMGVLGSILGGGGGGQQRPEQNQRQDDGGGLMGVLGSVLGGGGGSGQAAGGGVLGMGESILRHVLGGSQSRAATGVSKASGLDLGAVMKLLPMLAPLIMAALGRMTQKQQLDAGGLSQALGGEMQRLGGQGAAPPNFVTSILDADGDGDVDASDLMAHAARTFGAVGR
jgi:hypothetical protein